MSRSAIGGAAAGGEGAEAVGQAALIFGIQCLAGEKLGGERVACGQRLVEAQKAFRPAQCVAVDDAVADVEGNDVAFHRPAFVGRDRCGERGGLREETEAHRGYPGGLARLDVIRLDL
jgi:hypothetical protein